MTKWKNCPCTGETLDKLIHPTILSILAKGAKHGYLIAELTSTMPMFKGKWPDTAGVYRVLRTMEKNGLIESLWLPSKKGPKKKTYQLTDEGYKCLETWNQTLTAYYRATGKLLTMIHKARLSIKK